jgi:hypothetical protein
VAQQVALGAAPAECHHEGRDHEIRGLALGHGPSDQAAVEQVANAGQEQLSVPTVELTHVSDPALVRSARREVTLQPVRGEGRLSTPPPPLLASVHAHEALLRHQAGDSMTTDALALVT